MFNGKMQKGMKGRFDMLTGGRAGRNLSFFPYGPVRQRHGGHPDSHTGRHSNRDAAGGTTEKQPGPAVGFDAYLEGHEALQDGHYNKAIGAFNRLIEKRPDDASAFVNRGDAYLKKGDAEFMKGHYDNAMGIYDNAINDYTKAIELDPKNAKRCLAIALDNHGLAHYLKGEYNEAKDDFRRAIKISPGFKHAFLNRAKVYDVLGKPDLAAKDRRQAAALTLRIVGSAEAIQVL